MLKKKIFLFAVLLCSTMSVTVSAHNIEAPSANAAFRCSKTKPSKEKCKLERDYALKIGCISKEEFDVLSGYDGYPICNRDGEYEGWCPQGCFVRGTQILVTNKDNGQVLYVPVEDVVAHRLQFLVWCMTDSKNGFIFAPHEIKLTTQGPEEEAIVYLSLDNGSRIGLTTEHGVLLANGTVTDALSLKVGDRLFDLARNEISILGIHREYTTDDVFNLLVDDVENIKNHFIISEKIVVGDLAWQGSLRNKLNTIVLEN